MDAEKLTNAVVQAYQGNPSDFEGVVREIIRDEVGEDEKASRRMAREEIASLLGSILEMAEEGEGSIDLEEAASRLLPQFGEKGGNLPGPEQ